MNKLTNNLTSTLTSLARGSLSSTRPFSQQTEQLLRARMENIEMGGLKRDISRWLYSRPKNLYSETLFSPATFLKIQDLKTLDKQIDKLADALEDPSPVLNIQKKWTAQKTENVFQRLREETFRKKAEELQEGEILYESKIGYIERDGKVLRSWAFGPVMAKGGFGDIRAVFDLSTSDVKALKEAYLRPVQVEDIQEEVDKVGQMRLIRQVKTLEGPLSVHWTIFPLHLEEGRIVDGVDRMFERSLLSKEERLEKLPLILKEYIGIVEQFLALKKKGLIHTDIKLMNCVFSKEGSPHLIDLEELWKKGKEKLLSTECFTLEEDFVRARHTKRQEDVEHLCVFQLGLVFFGLLGPKKLPIANTVVGYGGLFETKHNLYELLGEHPLSELIIKMLSYTPDHRPSMEDILKILTGISKQPTKQDYISTNSGFGI